MSQTAPEKLAEIQYRRSIDWTSAANLDHAKKMLDERRSFLAASVMNGSLAGPVLEIGAEHAINGMILETEMGLTTAGLDLSPHALEDAGKLSAQLGLRVPSLRIAGDAERLPFVAESFRAVLLWGALHHFSDRALLLEEIRRVLAPGGWLVLAEEPMRRRLMLPLGRTVSADRLTGWRRTLMRLHVLPWFARVGGLDETNAGISEQDFTAAQWRQMFSPFDDAHWYYQPRLTGGAQSAGPLARALWQALLRPEEVDASLTRWFGGSVFGWARKSAPLVELPGGRYLVRKDPAHDSITLRGFAGAFLCQGETLRTETGSARLPDSTKGRSLLMLQIPRRPSRIDLWSSDHTAGYVVHRFSNPPRDDPQTSLACPDCVDYTDWCIHRLCREECVAACPHDALAPVDPLRPVRNTCDGCGRCLAACPYGGLDRPQLRVGRCPRCHKVFALAADVLELRPRNLRNQPSELHQEQGKENG